jgi:nucleoid DNA-binding protein
MTKKFEKGLVYVLREQLLSNKTIVFHDIGTFHVEHKQQMTRKESNGKTVILPPRDVLIFNSMDKNQ